MKFSDKWLREWVNPAITQEEMAEQLTIAGLEVDAITPVVPAFSGVVVGRVDSIAPHPDADKLQCCKVDVGDDELVDIVCGAKNVYEGMRAPVAKVGALLPGDFKIKKAKLRGQPSFGMLCSEQEIGLAESASGLMDLPQDAPVGEDIRSYLNLEDETIELGLTPDRGDCLSIRGIAREVSVKNNEPLNAVEIQPVAATIKDTLNVDVQFVEGCPRYLGRVIKNINPKAATPLWMQEKLRRCGLRSISPVVDITNFVLLELGQPMHAFDLATLKEGVIVREANEGEKIMTLDEQEVTLKKGTMVIADHQKVIALAGIMGGLETSVTDTTQDIFLESAFFAPLAIAGKGRQYKIQTDSSHRFERGVDPECCYQAIERATQLLLETVGGEAGPVIDQSCAKTLPEKKVITLRQSRVELVLGVHLEEAVIERCLTALGMGVTCKEIGVFEVEIPSYRFDITIEVDLIEEVARIYGYDQIPSQLPPNLSCPERFSETQLTAHDLKTQLVGIGYQETINYSFVDPKLHASFFPEVSPIAINNPIASDMSVMRQSLVPSLVSVLKNNLNRQQQRARIFEVGKVYLPQGEQVEEKQMIAGLMFGTQSESHFTGDEASSFFDIKGDVETLLGLSAKEGDLFIQDAGRAYLHPGQSTRIMRAGDCVGYIGALHPSLQQKLKIKGQKVWVFELYLEAVLNKSLPVYHAFSKFPSIKRDLAFVVEKGVSYAQMMQAIKEASGPLLVEHHLFDVYTGESVGENNKSLALSITLQHPTRTLVDEEVETVVTDVVSALQAQFKAVLRGE